MADDAEYVQLSIPEVFVYKVPPRASAQGHKASDWKEQVWSGKLQVVTKEDSCAVKLVGENGKVFAVAPVRRGGPPAAEKVTDSSRYFCLRIENDKGNHAFIGVGFNQRSDAFDFNVALAEWLKQADLDSGVTTALDKLELGPEQDFSLKQGQTFSIKVNLAGGAPGAKKPVASSGSGGLGGKLRAPGSLAAPPGSNSSGARPLAAPAASSGPSPFGAAAAPARMGAAAPAAAADDLLGLGFGAPSTSAPKPAASGPDADWVSF